VRITLQVSWLAADARAATIVGCIIGGVVLETQPAETIAQESQLGQALMSNINAKGETKIYITIYNYTRRNIKKNIMYTRCCGSHG